MPSWSVLVAPRVTNAPTTELWSRVSDYVLGPRRLLIVASGSWNYDPGHACGPDGDSDEGFDDLNLHKLALRGCLVAKIGGSAGDTPGSDNLLAIGSYGVIEVPEKVGGPLFVTMNDDPKRFHLHSGSLTITVSEAPVT